MNADIPNPSVALAEYRSRALAATLADALRNPFYRSKWADRDGILDVAENLTSAEEILEKLPIVSKSELQREIRPILRDGDSIASIIHTTGSTGPVTFRYRSKAELRKIAEFGISTVAAVRYGRPRPLAYMLYGPYHGQDMPGTNPVAESVAPYYFSGAVWDDIFIRQGAELLQRTFDLPGLEPRVTQIHGAVRLLRVFTQCMRDLGINPTSTAVDTIVSFAGYLPQESRDFLRDYWNINPIEIFSISEMMGGAAKCPHCGALSFVPHILAQAVELGSDQPLRKGVGRLVMTELYPFGSTQPLIRYFNGDLVRVDPEECPHCMEKNRIIHIGRDNEGAIFSEGGDRILVLASSDFREAAYSAYIARTNEYPHLASLRDRDSHVGAPLIGVSFLNNELRVVFRPNPNFDDSLGTEELVRETLLAKSSDLKQMLENGKVTLNVRADSNFSKPLWK